MSAWARVLWANQTGERAVSRVVTAATAGPGKLRAMRYTARSAAAATMQMRVRVPVMTYPERCHQAARKIEGNGGWAFERVVWGMRVPVRKRSQAAGM